MGSSKNLDTSGDRGCIDKTFHFQKGASVAKEGTGKEDTANRLENVLEDMFKYEDKKQETKTSGDESSKNTVGKRIRRLPKRYVYLSSVHMFEG